MAIERNVDGLTLPLGKCGRYLGEVLVGWQTRKRRKEVQAFAVAVGMHVGADCSRVTNVV